jgi:arylsulfatase A-like enzyme
MNVVLYILDDLRPDFLGCYGFEKETSPNIDSFAKEAVLYEDAYSTSNGTKAAAASIITSRYPHSLGTLYENNKLPDYPATLPNVLKKQGFKCYGVSANLFFSPKFGFSDFNEFSCLQIDEELLERRRKIGAKSIDMMPSEYVNEKAFPFFDKDDDKKFIMIWAVDPHGPFYVREGDESFFGNSKDDYIKIEEVDSQNVEKVKSLYCDMIHHNDHNFGQLIAKLKEKGIYEDSLIIVAGDHGESFGEHQWILGKPIFGHSDFVYEEVIKVPLIIKYPQNEFAGQRFKLPVQLIDIYPTILDTVKAEVKNVKMEGISLNPSRNLINENRLIFTEAQILPVSSYSASVKIGNQKLIKIETPFYFGRKLKRMMRNILEKIQIPSIQFYNLESDPAEKNNLAGQKKEEVKYFLEKYHQILKKSEEKDETTSSKGEVDEEVKKRLRNLGYFNE